MLGEQPGAGTVAGLLLILAGSWLSTDGRLPPGLLALLRRDARRTVRGDTAGAVDAARERRADTPRPGPAAAALEAAG